MLVAHNTFDENLQMLAIHIFYRILRSWHVTRHQVITKTENLSQKGHPPKRKLFKQDQTHKKCTLIE